MQDQQRLWCVFCEYWWANLPRYNGTALYVFWCIQLWQLIIHYIPNSYFSWSIHSSWNRGVSFVNIGEQIYRVITVSHCMYSGAYNSDSWSSIISPTHTSVEVSIHLEIVVYLLECILPLNKLLYVYVLHCIWDHLFVSGVIHCASKRPHSVWSTYNITHQCMHLHLVNIVISRRPLLCACEMYQYIGPM